MPFRRGSKWYIRVKGVRTSSGTSIYEDAKALEDRLNHEAWLHNKMDIKPPRSWKEAVIRWKKEKSGKVTIDEDLRKFSWLDSYLGNVSDICSITRDRIDALMQLREGVRTGGCSPENATANRYVALIAGVLNAAEKEWAWNIRAPMLRRYLEPESNGRCLTVSEWRSLEMQLPTHLRLAATFALCTGLREAKVFGLRWASLNQDRSLAFTGTANKIGNSIPLNAMSSQIVRECRSLPIVSPEYVFLYDGKPMKEHGQSSFKKAVERAEIGHVKWKDFRTTFNSWLAQAGVPREIRARLMGHVTNEVQDRYTRLYVEHLRPFAEIIDSVLSQSIGQVIAK